MLEHNKFLDFLTKTHEKKDKKNKIKAHKRNLFSKGKKNCSKNNA